MLSNNAPYGHHLIFVERFCTFLDDICLAILGDELCIYMYAIHPRINKVCTNIKWLTYVHVIYVIKNAIVFKYVFNFSSIVVAMCESIYDTSSNLLLEFVFQF